MSTRYRRTQIIVDKPFQWRATLIGMTYMIAITLVVAIPLVAMMRANGVLLIGRGTELVELYETQQRFVTVSLIVFAVGITGAWVIFNLWRTHKIAGPVVNMTRFLHNLSTGDFSERVQLRSKDEFQGLAGAINGMVEAMAKRDETMRKDLLEIAQSGSMDRLVAYANDHLSHDAPDMAEAGATQPDPAEPVPTA
ncbi:MAG: HAMP domain-containing protein [bacterium]|nr:HAMP domain-containing protein [bacterium]